METNNTQANSTNSQTPSTNGVSSSPVQTTVVDLSADAKKQIDLLTQELQASDSWKRQAINAAVIASAVAVGTAGGILVVRAIAGK